MAKPKIAKLELPGKELEKIAQNRTFLVASKVFIVLVVLVLAGMIYYTKVYSDPQRTFWAMIDNNLATNGVTKQITQQGSGTTTDSFTQLVFSPESRVHYIKKVTDKNTSPNSRLTLEGIATPQADYQRYSLIDRPGSTADYSSVYNLWLKSDQPTLFGNALFGAVLFGNLSQPQRIDVVNKLKNAYQIKLDTGAHQSAAHTRKYSVIVSLQKYAIAARAYAKAIGLPDAEKITPEAYQPTDRVELAVSVNTLSRQLTKVEYTNSKITETYVSYGVASIVSIPKKTVDNQQFQDALSSIKD
jgi:hypothetical protein